MNANAITYGAAGLIALAALFTGCTDAQSTERVVSNAGYAEVKATGFRLYGCGKGDWSHTGFTARASNGQAVSGVVCQGLFFKGATIRFD